MGTAAIRSEGVDSRLDARRSEDPISTDLHDLGKIAGRVTDEIPRDPAVQKVLFDSIKKRLMKDRKLKKAELQKCISIYRCNNGPCRLRSIFERKLHLDDIEIVGSEARIIKHRGKH